MKGCTLDPIVGLSVAPSLKTVLRTETNPNPKQIV